MDILPTSASIEPTAQPVVTDLSTLESQLEQAGLRYTDAMILGGTAMQEAQENYLAAQTAIRLAQNLQAINRGEPAPHVTKLGRVTRPDGSRSGTTPTGGLRRVDITSGRLRHDYGSPRRR